MFSCLFKLNCTWNHVITSYTKRIQVVFVFVFYVTEVNIRGTYVSSWACIFSSLGHLSSSVWLWSTLIDIIYINCPDKIVCLGVCHVSINHLRCLLPDCIIINLIPITCIYSLTYAHILDRGFKTSQQLLEFYWPLDNMLPRKSLPCITLFLQCMWPYWLVVLKCNQYHQALM